MPEIKSGVGDVRFKIHADAKLPGKEFVLSDETVDRMGDIIKVDGWDLSNFSERHAPALFNHDKNFVIGKWHNVRVVNGQLRGRLELASEDISERIREICRLVDADMLNAASVGFKVRASEPRMEGNRAVGEIYTKQELIETSLVSVPANPNALAVAKSLNVSPATLDFVFAASGTKGDETKQRGLTAATGDPQHRKNGKGRAMSLAQQITDTQTEVVALVDQLNQHLESLDNSNVSDKEIETGRSFNEKIEQKRKQLAFFMDSERNMAGTVGTSERQLVVPPREAPRAQLSAVQFSPPGTATKDLNVADFIVRSGTVLFLSKALNRTPEQIIREYEPYNNDRTRQAFDWNMRAAVNPALTSVTGWAKELVQIQVAPFMSLLHPKSILPRLAARGLTLTFGRFGSISVPTRDATPTIAGSFVGEGMPIPVRRAGFSAQTLLPKKLAVITTWSKEIDEYSIPAIEGLLREAIAEDTSTAVDSILIDSTAATAIRPAGLFAGVTPITPTAIGATPNAFNAITTDLKNLMNAITVSTKGQMRAPVWLMNPSDVLSASMIVPINTGVMPFAEQLARGTLMNLPVIDSGTMPAKSIAIVDAADFVLVGGEAPRFEISDSATVHEEDTTPLPIVTGVAPGTTATPVRSFWQTDVLGLRMVQRMNWAMRRTGMVAIVNNVTW